MTFRMMGAIYLLLAFGEIQMAIFDKHTVSAIFESASGGILGWCLIYFSKRLATLVCRGLED